MHLFNHESFDHYNKEKGLKSFNGEYTKDGHTYKTKLRQPYTHIDKQGYKYGDWEDAHFELAIQELGKIKLPLGVSIQDRVVFHVNTIRTVYNEIYLLGMDTGRVFVKYHNVYSGRHSERGIFPVVWGTVPVEPRFTWTIGGSVEKY